MDYDDVVSAFNAINGVITKFEFVPKAGSTEAEELTDKIFSDIQKGPIPELKDKKIVNAFQKAKDSKFEINVVATMSSGKSTLINALLGQKIMPAANEATTATIVKIIDTENAIAGIFDAIAYDKSGNEVDKIQNVTLKKMTELNKNENVSTIELYGKIPFVSSVGMKLVLVDTPGPNNSRDQSHREMTYRMLKNSDKNVILYVMNGTQLGIDDENNFLDFISDIMKEGGKQSRERFIFVANKMDSFNPKAVEEGGEGDKCIERALCNAQKDLEKRGIDKPCLFPVSSLAALESRTDDDEPQALDSFIRRTQKYPCFHFDNYYQFSHQSKSIKENIKSWLEQAETEGKDGEKNIHEIRTGIVNVEQAIDQYVNKYAKVIKVTDLVNSFNARLTELSAVAKIESEIQNNKEKKAELESQIQKIQNNIKSAKAAKQLSSNIDSMNLTKDAESKIESYMEKTLNTINALQSKNGKMKKDEAIKECNKIENKCKELGPQIKIQLEGIIRESYNNTIQSVLKKYEEYLKELNIGVDNGNLHLNPIDFVAPKLSNMRNLIAENTITKDEGHHEERAYTAEKDGLGWGILRTIDFLGLFDDATYETKYRTVWVSKKVDYVDMCEINEKYLQPILISIRKMNDEAIKYVKDETNRIKNGSKTYIGDIEKALNQRLENLRHTTADVNKTETEIKKQKADLKWLQSIEKRVNDIVKW